MSKQDYISLLNCIYPNFFEREIILGLPEKLVFHEMILPLNEFDICKYDKILKKLYNIGYNISTESTEYIAVI